MNCVHLVSHCVWKAEDKAFTLPSGELGSIGVFVTIEE